MGRAVVLCATIGLLAGCFSDPPSDGVPSTPATSRPAAQRGHSPSPSSSSPSTRRPPPRSTANGTPAGQPTRSTAVALLARMTMAERVGQLLMVDCPTTYIPDVTVAAITQHHVGSVILDGTSRLGVSGTARITAELEETNPSPAQLFIATDQEGGLVQRLQGPGFTHIPSALLQGRENPDALQAEARRWAGELEQAGVNVNLAPVMDTVPAGYGSNPPIGDLDREYGHTIAAVSSHGIAVARGLAAGGVDATVKHFPGLGRVAGNTDTSAGVTDSVTTRHDRYLAPFQAAIKAGVPFVMMSTAVYSRIDPHRPAAFSPIVIGDMLRGDLGFTGVVISDDVGNAVQLSGHPVGQRAVDFIAAGGDIVLTVDASQAAEMTQALLAKAQSDALFRSKVNAAALVVLEAKQARGLLG